MNMNTEEFFASRSVKSKYPDLEDGVYWIKMEGQWEISQLWGDEFHILGEYHGCLIADVSAVSPRIIPPD